MPSPTADPTAKPASRISPCCEAEPTLTAEGWVCRTCRTPTPPKNTRELEQFSGGGAELLTIAQAWHGWGYPVLPVVFRPKKNGVGIDKIPIVEYAHWKNGVPQTAEDVQAMPWDRAEAVGILLWPTSDRVVVDLDGDGADKLLMEAGIALPATGVIHTRSGGLHYHLKVPPGVKPPDPADASRDKRAIRLLHAKDADGKPCKPAVDFLLNGMVVVAGPGYREDPDHPVEPSQLAEVPDAVLALARAENGTARETGPIPERPATDYADLLRGVPLGIQHDTSLKLIGHYLPKLGPAETWEIIEPWCEHCTPPADNAKVRANFEDILAREAAKGQTAEVEHLTDLGNARRLVAQHREDLRYDFPRGKWLHWDGRRWGDDETGGVFRRGKETVRAMYAEAAQVKEEKAREALAAHALRSESDGRIRAMVSLARSEESIPVRPADLDQDPWALNTVTGTLDLRRG